MSNNIILQSESFRETKKTLTVCMLHQVLLPLNRSRATDGDNKEMRATQYRAGLAMLSFLFSYQFLYVCGFHLPNHICSL